MLTEHIADTFCHVRERVRFLALTRYVRQILHQKQADDHGQETQAVDHESCRFPRYSDKYASQCRTERLGSVLDSRIQTDGAGQVFPAFHHFHYERMPGWSIHGFEGAQQKCHHVNVPDFHDTSPGQHS